jgi:hypothetical protein
MPTMLAAMDCWLKMVKQGKIPAPFAKKPSKVRATERKKA